MATRSIQGQLLGGLLTQHDTEQEKCLRDFEITGMTGRDEEILAESQMTSAQTVTEILLRCVKRLGDERAVSKSLIRSLLVADRQYLMMLVRQLSFGDKVEALVHCENPNCHQRMDVDFKISEIPVTRCEHQGSYLMSLDTEHLGDCEIEMFSADNSLRFRLPVGEDQEVIANSRCSTEMDAICLLLSRCLIASGECSTIDAEVIKSWPSEIRRQIEERMESLAPSLDLTMEITCPECGTEFEVPFELQDFFLNELKANGNLLKREVHQLAFHYHWGEEEIMAMPRQRRQSYVGLLNEEIERINESIQ